MDPTQKNSLCIFCYKPSSLQYLSEDQNDYQEGNFLELFTRYIHLPQEHFEKVPTTEIIFCENCAVTVNSFCDSYHKLELIQLEISSQVYKLLGTMKSADKSPYRVSLFQKQLDSSPANSIKKLRRELISHCRFDILKESEYLRHRF